MISSKKFQNVYNSFYTEFKNFIWPMDTVKKLAELEQEIYKAFPDTMRIQVLLSKLELDIKQYLELDSDTEDLFNELNDLKEIISEDSDIYYTLDTRIQGAMK